MRVFLLSKEYRGESVYSLSKRESHYLFDVLRLKVNDYFTAKDRSGKYYKSFLCSTSEITLEATDDPEETLLDNLSSYDGVFAPINAFIAVLKNKKTETQVRMLTEIGVRKIILIETEFTEGTLNSHQMERLETIVREAVQQSGSDVPELIGPLSFADSLKLLAGRSLILHQSRRSKTLSIAEAVENANAVSFMIGPEGGFSDKECEMAELEGALPVLLPTNILRAETATVYSASAIQIFLNDFRNS